MASLTAIENPEEDVKNALARKKTLIAQKQQEVDKCMEKCNQLKRELWALSDLCPAGGKCAWEYNWYGSHGIKKCTKCGTEEVEMSKGGRRRRKTRERRKKKTRKTRKKRRRRKKKTKRRR